ncbi:MAG TPA: HEAT repeat domain-containing protein, partial [Gemmataceae bacterium]|nr:HEAT repeat domain-containing protein [Gemmataceae bacterium]
GPSALPFLRAALRDPDAEVSHRARRCLEKIEPRSDLPLALAAARLLAVRRPADAAPVLLAYLPAADDESLQEEVLRALAAAGLRDGTPDPAVIDALSDKDPARRAAAASVAARGKAEHRKAAARLLGDPDAAVRYRAAAALARAGDKRAVPALIALLSEGPPALAWQAEDILCRLAGDQPPAALSGADAPGRKKCRAAWEEWWKKHADKVDLAKLTAEEPPRGLTVICDCDFNGQFRQGRLWECGRDGKPRWHIDGVQNPADVQILPGGRFLVAECQGHLITERDRAGKVLWSHRLENYPVACQRLPNGNTFMASYTELREVTRDGKVLWSHKRPGSIYCAQKLRNGNVLYAHSSGSLVEMQTDGREVRTVNVGGLGAWSGVEPLPGGRYLVAQYAMNRVVEVDDRGKVLWECSVGTPAWATRLRNGNTLVTSTNAHAVIEVDRGGKEVWKVETQGRPFRVRRY